jgi:L-rhamnonate dehydratase
VRIKDVRTERLPVKGSGPSWLGTAVIANPMSIYAPYKSQRASWTAPWGDYVVRVVTDAGVEGVSVLSGGEPAATLVERHFARLLVGQDPQDIERLWDHLFRASLPYGRKGLPVMALSGVDAALWDLVGKAWNQPVYRLLGGSVQDDLPVYQTTNDPDDWVEPGWYGVKLAMPYGPADGWEGLEQNVALVKRCREHLSPTQPIMLDCYMAWDVEYTRRMMDAVAPYGVRWIEEPLPPDDYPGYERLGRYDSPVAIATGEHEYTRWGFRDLINTGGVKVLQPDVMWVGGITEARRVCAMASAYNLPVVPHAGGLQLPALHLMRSQVNCPLVEWVRTWDRAQPRPTSRLAGLPDPDRGRLSAPDRPGLGWVWQETEDDA